MKTKFRNSFGYARVGTAVPKIRVANPAYNAARVIDLMREAEAAGVRVLVFPELCLTGYTCRDLFHQRKLQQRTLNALEAVRLATVNGSVYSGLVFVGLPLLVDNQLFNCAAALYHGKILGVVPKSFIPTYKEFEELRWFAPASQAVSKTVSIRGENVPFGTDLLFAASDMPELIVGCEICEDLWGIIPPSSYQALRGATVLVNLSASNELIGKGDYRMSLVTGQSGRCYAAYVYASCGAGESSTDIVFGGHCIIAENGSLAAESKRFQSRSHLTYTDVDVERLVHERIRTNSYGQGVAQQASKEFRVLSFQADCRLPEKLERYIAAHPFVPADNAQLEERCREISNIQVSGLVQRLEYMWNVPCKQCQADLDNQSQYSSVKKPTCTCKLRRDGHVTIGISGGLDSTLAFLKTVVAMDSLGLPRTSIHAYTLPGFGTTSRTKQNALKLMQLLGVTWKEVDIREQCFNAMRADNKKPFGIDLNVITLAEFEEKLRDLPKNAQDLDFENEQARTRTKILMQGGFVIGTGDLSEEAVGWCTYNADQQSMYNVNTSVPKTLVRFLVRWAAKHEFTGEVSNVLIDITETEVSPELLPVGKDGKIVQKTNDVIGPDELRDFYMYYLVRFGFEPEKILYLAEQAQGWNENHTQADFRKWLKVFLKRFFPAQYKRSNMPDGPKVGSVSFSQRGDWRQPSDADSAIWLDWCEAEEAVQSVKPAVGAGAASGSSDSGESTRRAGISPAPATLTNNQNSPGAEMTADSKTPAITINGDDCLLVVDVQGGFTPKGGSWLVDGALAVPGGNEIIPTVNRLIAHFRARKAKRKATRDAHPANHVSFVTRHPGAKPYETILVNGIRTQVFVEHCKNGTAEAELHPDLDKDLTVYDKAVDPDVDALSGFFDFAGNKASKLPDDLKAEKVKRVFVCGLATNYCDEANALHAVQEGYETYLIEDACRGIDLPAGSVAASIKRMREAGVHIIKSSDLLG